MTGFYCGGCGETDATKRCLGCLEPADHATAMPASERPAAQTPGGEGDELAALKKRIGKLDADRARLIARGGPEDSEEAMLRAMAKNYSGGHRWDHLDGEAVTKAADEIKALRAALSTPALPVAGVGSAWPVGSWLSAALDDPKVCEAMKADIRDWFDNGGSVRSADRLATPASAEAVAWRPDRATEVRKVACDHCQRMTVVPPMGVSR